MMIRLPHFHVGFTFCFSHRKEIIRVYGSYFRYPKDRFIMVRRFRGSKGVTEIRDTNRAISFLIENAPLFSGKGFI